MSFSRQFLSEAKQVIDRLDPTVKQAETKWESIR